MEERKKLTDTQKNEIDMILKEGKVVFDNRNYTILNKEIDCKEIREMMVECIYGEKCNEKIDNPDYESMYEMKKNFFKSILDNDEFLSFETEYADEAKKVLKYLFKNKEFQENTTYNEIHEDIGIIENFAKSFPENSAEAIGFIFENGKEYFAIYKEVYKYLEYYSQTGVKLDYSIALKITKECKKNNIKDAKIIRERLSYTELNSFLKILSKNNMNNDNEE